MKKVCVLASLLLASCGSYERETAAPYIHPTLSEAQRFLGQQQAANATTMRSLQEARDSGRLEEGITALKNRRSGILKAIAEVENGIHSGRFHRDDRSLLVGPLEEELAWVTASLIALE